MPQDFVVLKVFHTEVLPARGPFAGFQRCGSFFSTDYPQIRQGEHCQ